ncbi:MAG: signal peptidase I [Candidatus Woesearchaeota archaeon]|jgi:signal peptidase I
MPKHKKGELKSLSDNYKSVKSKGVLGYLKRFWKFVWEDDSIWSWIVNIILAFVIIKFVLYPVLGLIFATSFPIVAVVSGSMEHSYAPKLDSFGREIIMNDDKVVYGFCQNYSVKDKSSINFRQFENFDTFWNICGSWYEKRNVSYEEFRTFDFVNGFNKGDIMVLHGTKMEDVKLGDIIVFRGKLRSDPIIHRVIAIEKKEDGYHFTTKGDHNEDIFYAIGENDTTKDNYLAKAVFKIPYLGWIKIWFTYIITGFQPIR